MITKRYDNSDAIIECYNNGTEDIKNFYFYNGMSNRKPEAETLYIVIFP